MVLSKCSRLLSSILTFSYPRSWTYLSVNIFSRPLGAVIIATDTRLKTDVRSIRIAGFSEYSAIRGAEHDRNLDIVKTTANAVPRSSTGNRLAIAVKIYAYTPVTSILNNPKICGDALRSFISCCKKAFVPLNATMMMLTAQSIDFTLSNFVVRY